MVGRHPMPDQNNGRQWRFRRDPSRNLQGGQGPMGSYWNIRIFELSDFPESGNCSLRGVQKLPLGRLAIREASR